MKISVDADCTPEELRRLLGFPDLTPVHEADVERMKKAATDGVSPESFTELARNWAPMSEAGSAMWKGMLEGMSARRDG